MHKPLGAFRYPFESHAIVHHTVFKADHTYLLINEKDRHIVTMAWWNGPVLVSMCILPFVILSFIFQKWGLVAGSMVSCTAYYVAYEYMHYCMHVPRKRNLERSGIFFRLNGHHLLHHRFMHKNFNVVLPIVDLLFGTLLVRSPIQFKQAEGPALPNVQPRNSAPTKKQVLTNA